MLLIDQHADARQMYSAYLRSVQLNPIELADTVHAVAHAVQADVIVTAIRVPGPFDGIELVRRLRENKSTQRKPVIVLSACALPADQDRAWEAGCTAFLSKPCLPDALAREIETLLAIARGARGDGRLVPDEGHTAAERPVAGGDTRSPQAALRPLHRSLVLLVIALIMLLVAVVSRRG